MDDRRAEGLRVAAEMFPEIAEAMEGVDGPARFAADLGELALTDVFGALWARPDLDRRSRSLVTLGILIALGASEELAIHLRGARVNGLEVRELEEVIYHAAGYAGFPMASRPAAVGERIFGTAASSTTEG
jgi:4-carboxymuconolactone decarboxylase